jgi:hypothetical protein
MTSSDWYVPYHYPFDVAYNPQEVINPLHVPQHRLSDAKMALE